MTAALKARQRVHNLFRLDGTAVDHACRAARDEYAALPDLDPEDPASWDSYQAITSDLQTLLAYMAEVGVPSSAPTVFRTLVIRVLRYLSMADKSELGMTLSTAIYREWSGQLGETHPDVINVLERQAACHNELNDSTASAELMKEVLARRKAVFGDDDPRTLRAAANLGTSLNSLGDFHAALRLNQETVRHCRARLGPDHDTTLDAASILACSLFGLGEHEWTSLTLTRAYASGRRATPWLGRPPAVLAQQSAVKYSDPAVKRAFKSIAICCKDQRCPTGALQSLLLSRVLGERERHVVAPEAERVVQDCHRRPVRGRR